MRKPRNFTYAGRQSLQIRILLAHSIIRRRTTHQMMPRMLVLRQIESLAHPQLNNHTPIVAVRLLQPWHDMTTPNSARRLHTRTGGSRQVYQMDWSQANQKDLIRLCSRVHQWNTPQIQFPQHNHNRSWIKLYFTRILGLLRELQHLRQICISRTHKSQWLSGTHQRTDNWRLKEKDLWFYKQERRKIASRTTNGNLGATHPT